MTEQHAARSRTGRRQVTLVIPLPSLPNVRPHAWMIGPPLILALLAALLATQVQARTFRAQAQVLLSISQPAVLGSQDPRLLAREDSRRFMTSQASIARSVELAARVVTAAGVPAITPHQFLRHSSAKPQSDASILNLAVVYPKPAVAVRLANAYATEFTRYKAERDVAAINEALRAFQTRITSLRAQSRASSPLYDALVQRQLDLKTIRQLLANSARVLQPADGASSFRPHALRNGLLGGALGALLGVALVVAVTSWRSSKSR